MTTLGAARVSRLWRLLARHSGGGAAARPRPLAVRLAGGAFVCSIAAPVWLARHSSADDDAEGRNWGVDCARAADGGNRLGAPPLSAAVASAPEARTASCHADAPAPRTGLTMLSDSRSQADDDAGDAFRQRVEVRVDVRREAFPGDRPGFATCARIAGANVAVYAGWWLLPEAFMTSWFTSSAVEAYVRPWKGLVTALTSSFSHREFWHLGFNMVALMSFGPALVDGPYRHNTGSRRLTASEFLRFYVVSGVGAGLASTAFHVAIRSPQRALGASGALFAVVGYYTMTHPDARVLILFLFDMTAMQAMHLFNGVNAFLVYRAWAAARKGQPGPMFDGMAHLAGTGMGVAYYLAKSAATPPVVSGGGGGGSGGARNGGAGRPRVVIVPEPGPSVPVRRTHPSDSETDV